ncbi:hypothetical protein [Janibacter melonis]|uniref:hypothetical protein n=1 Tax=Janibacter melonis TaxID=262209 RepID=UPI001E4CD170|nr:hypothetical protein [Janibacter melonis]MCB5991105.1 hypothetical protein [Janibacter melonis]
MSIETRDPHVPQPAAPEGDGVSPDRARRSARVVGHAIIGMWLVLAALAWAGGARVVTLDQLERDVSRDTVSALGDERYVPGSAWWSWFPIATSGGGDASGLSGRPGAVVYQRDDSLVRRTYVVLPAARGEGDQTWDGLSVASDEWRGAERERLDAVLVQLDDQRPQARAGDLPSRWLTEGGFVAVMVVGSLAVLAVLLRLRPTHGNRWYWFWVLLALPGGVGWLLYARREHLDPSPRVRRYGGWSGVASGIAYSFLLAVGMLVLVSATGMTVIPR